MQPIEFRGDNEEFTVKITDEEIESLKDFSGEIRYEKVFDFCLPRMMSKLCMNFKRQGWETT
jgi:hypothetical protein